MTTIVEIESENVTVEVIEQPTITVEVAVPGPQGPQGTPGTGGAGLVFVQSTPLATWNFTHGLGRLPNVSIYIGGELVFAPVDADTSTITITFPSPQTGAVVIN